MPRPYHNYKAIFPCNYSMSISSKTHFCKLIETPRLFVQNPTLCQVSLGICDWSTTQINGAFDFYTLTVPKVREIFVLDDSFLLCEILHVKDDYLIMVKHVKPDFTKLYFNKGQTPWNLHTVIEARELLKLNLLFQGQEAKNHWDTIAFCETLEAFSLVRSIVAMSE